jgi:muramoyltetrapeptide carboxypeptidase
VIQRTHVIKPKRLRPGDLIGVVSPAGVINRTSLESGLDALKSFGFRVRLGPHLFKRHFYLAGTDQDRTADLYEMFQENDVAAVFCARGGYGSQRLLNKLDFGIIKRNPKILLGYSDITALLLAVHAKTGLVTFHGPTVREMTVKDQGNMSTLLQLLSAKKPPILKLDGEVLFPGKATGRLLGGNLSLLCHLMGADYLPTFDGSILFLEEKGEKPYRIDRMLTHLMLTGQLNRLSGLVVGQFVECGNLADIKRLFINIASELKIPLTTGLMAGHGHVNNTLPIGVTAHLNTDDMTLSIVEECVN